MYRISKLFTSWVVCRLVRSLPKGSRTTPNHQEQGAYGRLMGGVWKTTHVNGFHYGSELQELKTLAAAGECA